MFEQNFKNIDNKLRSDAGCSSELDYVEQSSWILFLKYLNDYEETKKLEKEADIKVVNEDGRTPAEEAAREGRTEIAEFLRSCK